MDKEKDIDKELNSLTEKKEEIIDYPPVSYFRLQYACSENTDYLFLIIGVLGSIGMGISMPIFSLIFGRTINNFGPSNDSNDFVQRINTMVLNFIYCAIGVFISSGLMITMFSMVGKRIVIKLKKKYFETIMKQEQGFFDKANPYRYSTKVQSQMAVIEKGVNFYL